MLDLSIARPPGPAPPGLGTFCYLSPEQARGGMLTPAADVWGIGITLYEAATGDVPFDDGGASDRSGAESTAEATENHGFPQLDERAPPVKTRRRLPRRLTAAIDGCLAPDPATRPPLAQLAVLLDELLPQGLRETRSTAAIAGEERGEELLD
ncbi:protein kinase [Streptomyces sp. NPDC101150]|uniref:protein kinase domain-containing protein n=1 Tax=Streptomyces sp. NPDC101150 TaxID=3366114 RepID=UPI0038040C21